MATPEKEILRMFTTYAKLVNAQVEDLHRRLSKLDGRQLDFPPTLQRQLAVIEAALDRLGE